MGGTLEMSLLEMAPVSVSTYDIAATHVAEAHQRGTLLLTLVRDIAASQ